MFYYKAFVGLKSTDGQLLINKTTTVRSIIKKTNLYCVYWEKENKTSIGFE